MLDYTIDILDLADKAARCVLGRRPRQWTKQDWEDAIQEGAAAIWALGIERYEGARFLAAKHAIIDWVHAWLRHPRGGTLLDYLDYTEDSSATGDTIRLAILAPLLEVQRAKKVEEDIRYLELLTQHYSTDGIGMEMGLTRRRVYAIRERLLPRLERIARGEVPPTHSDAVRTGKAQHRAMVDR